MKKMFFGFVIILLSALFLHAQEMVSGQWRLTQSDGGFSLNSGNGDRIMQKEIRFAKPFESKPDVSIMVSFLDVDRNQNIRYDVKAISVSRDGFVIRVKTWNDTKIFGIGGYWFAEAEKLEIKKEEIQVGQTIELKNVFFAFNKWDLLPESYPELNKVVEFLKENPTVEIELAGHTDNIGADAYNMELSDKRANSVRTYIVAQGISESRLRAKGYGKTKPIAPNEYDWGREKNRRVEFTILKK
ncbi:outer membrane protein [hydrocarbon metagenome]|uniref:Outer membrane protein n=1 Tax=hydrocarbon metagenome TaxID=938273 RepID=A0A0W8FWY2_9ZZZZ